MSVQTKYTSTASFAGSKGIGYGDSGFSSASYSGSSIRTSSRYSSSSISGVSYSSAFGGSSNRLSWHGSGNSMGTLSKVTANKTLLQPLNLDIDRNFCAVRTHEKEQIKTLNNRFATVIEKVRMLEQKNKMLETKWDLLKNQTPSTSTVKHQFEAYITKLHRQLDHINNEGDKLQLELQFKNQTVEEIKQIYEDEVRKRCNLEDDFIVLKKEFDQAYLAKDSLEQKQDILTGEINFLRVIYGQEIRELETRKNDISVIVEMDNSRSFNMDKIVADVKAQYEHIAARNREEVDLWYKAKVNQMSSKATKYDDELRITKGELAEITRKISHLQTEIETIREQRSNLHSLMDHTKAEEERKLEEANKMMWKVEEALKTHKQEMVRLVKDYQELMNAKLALDMEIATYRTLLEEEEYRIENQQAINIRHVPNISEPDIAVLNPQKKINQKYLIKLTETENNTQISIK